MSRERRRLFLAEEPSAEPGRYGCPMLFRTRFHLTPDAVRPVARCALRWAVHNEIEAARCAATDAVTDCWKVHPERTPVVVLPTAETQAEADAIAMPAKVAGD